MCDDTDCDSDAAGRIYVSFVSVLIGFIGITSQIFVFYDHYGGATLKCLIALGTFNLLFLHTCYSYYLSCKVAPGHVPLGWEPPLHGVNVYEVKRNSQKPRYCRVCKAYKPPRTHHCSDCEKCVLKMDHHCPWVNNCVGYYNHGHFLRFIYSVVVTCSMAMYIHCSRLYELIKEMVNYNYHVRQPTQAEVGFLITNICLLFLVLMFVGALCVYHLFLVISNTTTIEKSEKKRVEKLISKGHAAPCEYPYDLGMMNNLKSVFGDNPLLWWLPTPAKGDGLDFPIKKGLVPPVYWPPPEYHMHHGSKSSGAAVTAGCSGNVLYESNQGRVQAEIDDDGETVIRQYNYRQDADPESLEGGGDIGEPKSTSSSSWKFWSKNNGQESESGAEFSDDLQTDSDDDEYGLEEFIDDKGKDGRMPNGQNAWTTSANTKFMIPGQSSLVNRTGGGAFSNPYEGGSGLSGADDDDDDDDEDNRPLLHVVQRKLDAKKSKSN